VIVYLRTGGSVEAIERLAKYYEHRRRDDRKALRYTVDLISRDVNNLAHPRRKARLLAKLNKG
jgi:hypothetical protein